MSPSPRLFAPAPGGPLPLAPGAPRDVLDAAARADRAARALVGGENYPCAAAVGSLRKAEYLLGVYGELGAGSSSADLAADLVEFKRRQAASASPYYSFWAVFDGGLPASEEAFESAFWEELSRLSGSSPEGARWDPKFSADPADKNFCFSFAGDAYFLVGMHPRSSRLSRRFPLPAIVFNLFEQFEALGDAYEPMVKANRARDVLYQGQVNPTVARWADVWESIQFSGRENGAEWKCPFRGKR